MGSKTRSWVSSITAIVFVMLAVTGLFMLFHVRVAGFHALHEMMGILFCIVGVYHLTLNWRALMKHLQSRAGIVAVTITAVLGVLLFVGGASHEREEGMRGGHGGPRSFEER